MHNNLVNDLNEIIEIENAEVPSEAYWWAGLAVGVVAVGLAD
ncbi:hypothetical protein [Fructobacillus evanidus]|uniref:Class IIb bacteriocin, lactobin A/cerein 7B family n=1 Tax=Fructobacillus evanidus TaxID=3064281 RepID=A0ABM9MY98_9LACO|nr:unnamed protein product [Fructobacillus sp. LMG 32999]CAK1247599.1 unnamed protein product [Fructobacillus sp. LMG 32999]CAK1248429.1 unnamed protein product [Fructobacillus sp. LMG 32999]CAK1248749.1 unnamed protein product [Fructobacillus sp. LMG 32999]CAK1254151.1 unnamed protein product [Fructobacillus sp. LMG 32999]